MKEFFGRVWTFARPYQARLWLGMACGLLFALTNALLAVTIKLVVDLVFTGSAKVSVAEQFARLPSFLRPVGQLLTAWLPELKSPESTFGLALVICAIPAVMLARVTAAYVNIYMMNWAAMRAIADLRTRLFCHLQDLPSSFYSEASTGALISRITNDTQVLYAIVADCLASLIKDPITILVMLAVMLAQQPTLTLVSMVVLPVCLIPANIYNRKARKSARLMQGHLADLTSLMHESFTGNRIIKAYNLEAKVVQGFRETTRKYISQMMRLVRANDLPGQFTEFLGAVGVALVLLYVYLYTDRSQTSPGDFFGFIAGIVLMYQPVKMVTRLSNRLHQAAAGSEQIFKLLDIQNTVVDPPSPRPLKAAGADIEFRNIDFSYGDKLVLRGINLRVKAGQVVALVGKSGSGKTTLTNLLLRFYDPTAGAVLIGGTDIRQVAIKDLRQQIALVSQETLLFNDTVSNNIGLGRPGASAADIEAAARHAYAHEFILEKPQGYDTVVGEKGAMLSMGQRQRVTIARALLKDAPILVLDEATSALDTESERAVQAALEQLMRGRTTICIAHRLSTIQNADLIVVLEDGRIIETGTHSELLENRGTYRKLHDLAFEPALA